MNALIQRTKEQGALLNTFVRKGPHYFLVEDENDKVVEISEAYARDLFGVTADEMIGKDYWIFGCGIQIHWMKYVLLAKRKFRL